MAFKSQCRHFVIFGLKSYGNFHKENGCFINSGHQNQTGRDAGMRKASLYNGVSGPIYNGGSLRGPHNNIFYKLLFIFYSANKIAENKSVVW